MDDDQFWRRPPRDRREFVAGEIERLDTSPAAEPEAVTARKAAERKAAIERHDEFWGIKPGDLIDDYYKVPKPRFTAGEDPVDRDD